MQNKTELDLIEERLVDIICKVRNGAMDDKQFRATVEYNIRQEIEKLLESIEREIIDRKPYFYESVNDEGMDEGLGIALQIIKSKR